VTWITKNPGTQFTASFHPIEEHAKAWYKGSYRPTIIPFPRKIGEAILQVLIRLVPVKHLRVYMLGFFASAYVSDTLKGAGFVLE
jgi:hypothetical protein